MSQSKKNISNEQKIIKSNHIYSDWIDVEKYSYSNWEDTFDIKLTTNGIKNTGSRKIGLKKRKTKSDIKNKKQVYHSRGVRKKINKMIQK